MRANQNLDAEDSTTANRGAAVAPLTREEAERKLRRFVELQRFSLKLAMAGLRNQFPNADQAELRRRLRERLDYGRRDKWRGPREPV